MGTIATFSHYGYEYSVFQACKMFKVKRTSRRTGKAECVYTDEAALFDNCDEKSMNDLLQNCTDGIFLARLLQRHRAAKKAIRALFTAQDGKSSHSGRNEAQT